MQRRRTRGHAALLALVIAASASCGGATEGGITAPDTTVATVVVTAAGSTLYEGQSTTVAVVAKNASGSVVTGSVATWTSSDPSVATVSAAGVVNGLKAGTANITATMGGKSGAVALTVAQVPVSSVILTPITATLYGGQTLQLVATAKDSAAGVLASRVVTFTTSAATIATVSTSGLVTAVSVGTTTITATAEGKSAPMTLSVALVPVRTVTLKLGNSSLIVGQTTASTVVLKDSAGGVLSGRVVSYASSATGIATVDVGGVVTGSGDGSAVITATSEGQSASVTVQVSRPASVIVIAPETATVRASATLQLVASVYDQAGVIIANPTVSWTSAMPAVATVSATGVVSVIAATVPTTVAITAASGGRIVTASVFATPAVIEQKFNSVTLAGSNACGVTTSGRMFCWGINSNPKYDGTLPESGSNRPYPAQPRDRAYLYAAASGCAVGTDLQPYCLEAYVSVGNQGFVTLGPAGLQVVDWRGSGDNLAPGGNHTCAVTASGTAFCIGNNQQGQLGTGVVNYRSDTWVPVSGGRTWKLVVATKGNTCGVTSAGDAYCWGSGGAVLGSGDSTSADTPTPVLVSGGYKWADLALGDRFVCGVTVTGAAYCWGGGNGGQLGNGSFGLGVAQRPIPTLVQGGLSFIKISAGGESVCAITTNNSGYCWGVDHRPYGGVQVGGLGTQAPLKTCDKDGLLVFCSPVPALVAGGIAWKQIVPSPGVAGWACGVSTNDDAYCWGTNDYGRLGSGLDITGSQTPTKVAGTYYP